MHEAMFELDTYRALYIPRSAARSLQGQTLIGREVVDCICSERAMRHPFSESKVTVIKKSCVSCEIDRHHRNTGSNMPAVSSGCNQRASDESGGG